MIDRQCLQTRQQGLILWWGHGNKICVSLLFERKQHFYAARVDFSHPFILFCALYSLMDGSVDGEVFIGITPAHKQMCLCMFRSVWPAYSPNSVANVRLEHVCCLGLCGWQTWRMLFAVTLNRYDVADNRWWRCLELCWLKAESALRNWWDSLASPRWNGRLPDSLGTY